MAIQLYQPGRLFRQFDDEINRLFGVDGQASGGDRWSPAVDLRERADAYVIDAEVPGIDPEGIEITLERGVLSLTGERQAETDESDRSRHVERRYGRFLRRFSLPEDADETRIEAHAEQGVLRVTIGKKAEAEPRRIAVAV